MSSTWSLQAQKLLLTLSLAAALVLLCSLARRRLGAHEEAQRERLVYRLLANVSAGLDRLELGLDELTARAALAKAKLEQLAEARRRSVAAWAAIRERAEREAEKRRAGTLGSSSRRTLSRIKGM